jgi:superfamily II DNA/RNA helicase
MVSKLSNFQPRSDFIARTLRDLIEEQPDQQIIVLSFTRSLLTNICQQLRDPKKNNKKYSIGYYVGGMKPEDLQETEEKQIVLATYAMAAEALDIKSLNTLMMISPKTDIIQSVGRILRTRGENKLIVDIVDTHTVFQNQWKKRRSYYKKCGYGIRFISSLKYTNMSIHWDQDTTWKRIASPNKQKDVPVDILLSEDTDSEEDTNQGDCIPKPKKEFVCWISEDMDFDRPCY